MAQDLAKVAKDRFGDRVIHQYVPLDLKPTVSRFLDHWRPDLAVIAESEIWPMTILELGARGVPQVLVNGRMSDRSFASWKKRSSLAEALFENLAHVVAQSEVDGERFRALGARPVTVSGNLKVDTPPPPAPDPAAASPHTTQPHAANHPPHASHCTQHTTPPTPRQSPHEQRSSTLPLPQMNPPAAKLLQNPTSPTIHPSIPLPPPKTDSAPDSQLTNARASFRLNA